MYYMLHTPEPLFSGTEIGTAGLGSQWVVALFSLILGNNYMVLNKIIQWPSASVLRIDKLHQENLITSKHTHFILTIPLTISDVCTIQPGSGPSSLISFLKHSIIYEHICV